MQNENTDLRLEERAELFEKLGMLYNLKSGGKNYESKSYYPSFLPLKFPFKNIKLYLIA